MSTRVAFNASEYIETQIENVHSFARQLIHLDWKKMKTTSNEFNK